MTKPKTALERKRAERARYREQGRKPLTLYVLPQHEAAIRAYAETLLDQARQQQRSRAGRTTEPTTDD